MTPLHIIAAGAAVLCVALTWAAARRTAAAGGQAPAESMREAWCNIAVGYAINFAANIVLLPLVGVPADTSLVDVFILGLPYTAVSLVRQFVIRRRFDATAGSRSAVVGPRLHQRASPLQQPAATLRPRRASAR